MHKTTVSKATNKKPAKTPSKVAVKDTMQTLHGEVSMLAFRLRGDRLLVHQWGQKAVLKMIADMSGHPMPQLNKDLTQEGLDSAYHNERDEDVLPCRVIKACLVNGAAHTNGAVKGHQCKTHVQVIGHTAPLHFETVNRRDIQLVKVGPWNERVVDIRSRTLYKNWYCDIVVKFPHVIIGKDKVALALRAAGESVGLCEQRIEKGFNLGGFVIEALPPNLINSIIAANNSPEKRFVIPEELLVGASAQLVDVDKRNPKKKMVAVVNGVNGALTRHADAEEMSELS